MNQESTPLPTAQEDSTLPPLPNASYAGIFTPEQMYAYAREAIAALVAPQGAGGGELVMRECMRCGLSHPAEDRAWSDAVAHHLGDTGYGPPFTDVFSSVEACIRASVRMRTAATPSEEPAQGEAVAWIRPRTLELLATLRRDESLGCYATNHATEERTVPLYASRTAAAASKEEQSNG